MRIENYPEIIPGKNPFKKIYLAVFLWITGRAIQAAARTDRVVKKEFEMLPDDFMLYLGVSPNGPGFVVGKDSNGKAKYMGAKLKGKSITLKMIIKNIEAAFLVFTFQESTAVGFAHDRFMVSGNLDEACRIGRVLDIVEIYLLPKIITKLAVKRYPGWKQMSPIRKHVGRVIIYTRAILGF